MNLLAILLRGSTALVLTVASVETFGPALDSRERFASAAGHTSSTCASRGAFHSLAGQALVANPAMSDPTFAGSVVYMLHHDGDGAIGIVLTRPLPTQPGDLALHDGGPVGADTLFLLHFSDAVWPTTKMLEPGLALTRDANAVDDIVAGRGPKRAILAWGYAGFGPSQLESEIAAGAWRVEPIDAKQVLDHAVLSR